MEKIISIIAVTVIAIFTVGFFAVLCGTVIWLIWPVAIPAAFPGAVTSGMIAAKLSYWSAVCLTWVFAILIKSSSVASK
jgi:hypothetical protein